MKDEPFLIRFCSFVSLELFYSLISDDKRNDANVYTFFIFRADSVVLYIQDVVDLMLRFKQCHNPFSNPT